MVQMDVNIFLKLKQCELHTCGMHFSLWISMIIQMRATYVERSCKQHSSISIFRAAFFNLLMNMENTNSFSINGTIVCDSHNDQSLVLELSHTAKKKKKEKKKVQY